MVDDAGSAQARLLLVELYEQVAEISQKIEAAENRGHRASIRGAAHDRRHQSSLRRELYEAHRLIDGLHRRFSDLLKRAR
jgi:predicted  nucleic acid-binding Zn-ribbon protein